MSIYGAGGRLLCVECKCFVPPDDCAIDFGEQRALCRGCAGVRENPVTDEDELTETVRNG